MGGGWVGEVVEGVGEMLGEVASPTLQNSA
jgi:hypothetical protein